MRELSSILAAVLKEYGGPSTNSEHNGALTKREEAIPKISDKPEERVKEVIHDSNIPPGANLKSNESDI